MDTERLTRPWSVLVGVLVLVALIAVWAAQGALTGSGVPVGHVATIAVGMTLQAIPFLLLSVFVAELTEAFVSPVLITCVLPTNSVASVLIALVAAFLLPVCDCSAVPIPCSLLCEGIPLSAATTLMPASPAINPLVIASTYYTSGSWAIVGVRIGLSIIVALSAGLSMLASPPSVLREEAHLHDGGSCGYDGDCETPDRSFSDILGATGHSFGRILPYLPGGVAASTTAQVFWPASSLLVSLPAPGVLALMMATDFALSLCSSSDAVIARSLTLLASQGALMEFMVYSPMMDVKNVALLPLQFCGAFMLRLFATVTCIAVAVTGGVWWVGVFA